ncbi:MAG: hypothetical protein K1X92_19055, partial [Bacteroidia bacterium]|nr:hypothetical protein [Bacteroidia bacterium]
ITTYAYDILSPGELQTYLPAWRSVFVVSELSRRKTVQIDSSGTIRYRNEIRPLIPPAQEKSEAEKLLWKYMGQLTDNLKEQIAPKGKDTGKEYFPPDFPADLFSQSNWKILTLEPEAHDKIPGLTRTWKAVLRPVLDAFAEITILGVTLTKKILLPIEGATLTVRFAGNLVTDLDIASSIALKTTRKTEPLKIAAANLVYVTSEAILEMLEFGFRIVDGGLRVREIQEVAQVKASDLAANLADYLSILENWVGETYLWVYNEKGTYQFKVPYTRNEIHFVNQQVLANVLGATFNYLKISERQKPGTGNREVKLMPESLAETIQPYSIGYIGENTIKELGKIRKDFYSKLENLGNETGGFLYISNNKELLPFKIDIDSGESRLYNIGAYLLNSDNIITLKNKKLKFFCLFHTHPNHPEPSGTYTTGGENIPDLASDGDMFVNLSKLMEGISSDFAPQVGVIVFRDTVDTIPTEEPVLVLYRTHEYVEIFGQPIFIHYACPENDAALWGNPNDKSKEESRRFYLDNRPNGIVGISTRSHESTEFKYTWLEVNQTFFKTKGKMPEKQ